MDPSLSCIRRCIAFHTGTLFSAARPSIPATLLLMAISTAPVLLGSAKTDFVMCTPSSCIWPLEYYVAYSCWTAPRTPILIIKIKKNWFVSLPGSRQKSALLRLLRKKIKRSTLGKFKSYALPPFSPSL